MSFEISNHFEIFYDKEKENPVGKKKLSSFVKNFILKAFDIAEGVHDKISIE
jgi:hypothetical protein